MSRSRRAWDQAWKLALAAVIILPLYALPLLYLVGVSFQTPSQFLRDPLSLPHPFTPGNYPTAWVEGDFGQYFINSVIYTASATLMSVLFAVFIAFPIARRYVRGGSVIYSLFLAGFFLPISIVPLFIEAEKLGLYNTQWGYILLHLQLGLTLGVLFFVGYFNNIPKELDESAQLDGCGYFRYVTQILIPLSTPALVTVAIYSAVATWNDLIGPVVFLATNSYFPLTRGLFSFYGQYESDWTLLAAGVLIVAMPLILAFGFIQRYLVRGATAGALKL
ncbi:MAG: carbohydrate ABC transporter permease [Firmicutes bacterium]|nr:carbohydrate ABC transporter permease [Bacillota bacterium]